MMGVLSGGYRRGVEVSGKVVKSGMDRRQRSRPHPGDGGRLLPDLKVCLTAILTILFVLTLIPSVQAQSPVSTKQLFQAVEVNDIGAVKKAIAAGADLNARDVTGMTAADLAVDKGHFIIAHYLLSERSARKSAKRKTTTLKALDLTRRATTKKSAVKTTSPAKPPVTKTTARKRAPKKPTTRRTELAKSDRFEMPPRKPQVPIVGEVAVATGPGVDQPDGSEPPESSETEMPRLAKVEKRKVKKASGKNTLGPVGSFFQSLVDLVTPDDPASPATQNPPTRTADSRDEDDPDKHLARELEEEVQQSGDELMQPEIIETVEITDDMPLPEVVDTEAQDDLPLPEDTETENRDEESLLENLVEDDPPELSDDDEKTSADRTFDRIKNLLSPDNPKEDEFGLPIIDDPAPSDSAVDSVLDQLADEPNLDDPAGPETGPERDVITAEDQGQPRTRASEAMRNRLKRLGDALSRDVQVDTNAILDAGRRKYAHDVPREPTEPTAKRSDIATDKMMTEGRKLKPRKTPAGRFNERLEKIREMENTREDDYGLPTKKAGDKKSEMAKPTEAEQGPSTVDRMIGFFTGKQRKPVIDQENEVRIKVPPAYRKAPDTGKDIVADPDQSDIANLDAFDKEDETRPVVKPDPAQVRGNIPPEFLERLSVLFNEEGQALEQGWTAQARVGEGMPTEGEEPEAPEETAWTTTAKLNVGEGRPMAVIKVLKSEVPADEVEVLEAPDGSSGKRQMMAKAPYSDPLKSPQTKKETRQKAFFSRLTKLFQPKDRDNLPRESLLLEQDEKLSTIHDALKADVKVASRTLDEVRTYWPITELTKADSPPVPERNPNALTRTSLSGVVLTLGESVNLDNTFPPGNQGKDSRNQCVKKNRGTTLFCMEPVDWPDDLKSTFQVATILYTGPMAIARFDQGSATRLHSLFNSEDFEKVSAYYQKRFGEPTEILKRSIAPLAQPRQDNPTISWRDRDPETNAISILEIRKFDDTRGGFPDTKRGAVMLYFVNSPVIFPQVSAHELMQLKRVAKATETEAELAPEPNVNDAPASSEVAPDELFGAPADPDSEAMPADPVLDSLTDDTATPSLDELLKDAEEPMSDNILDQLTTDNPNDLLENLPGEKPVIN